MRESTKRNLKTLGFSKEVKRVENKKCPFCGSKKTERKDFRDELSWKEFNISGLCQNCMDIIF